MNKCIQGRLRCGSPEAKPFSSDACAQGLSDGSSVEWEVELLDFERQVRFLLESHFEFASTQEDSLELTPGARCQDCLLRPRLPLHVLSPRHAVAADVLSRQCQAHATQLSAQELLARGAQLKDQGNVVFKQVIPHRYSTIGAWMPSW